MGLTIFHIIVLGYFPHTISEIFYGILSVPHSIVMDLNNVMSLPYVDQFRVPYIYTHNLSLACFPTTTYKT